LGGGLSNVATVIAELLESNQLDPAALTEQAANYSTAVVQRAGHLIDQMGDATDAPIDLQPLHDKVAGAQVVDLYPEAERTGERDRRWNVAVNIEIEPDL
jgi:predicted transcriptional regulator of viral defense system